MTETPPESAAADAAEGKDGFVSDADSSPAPLEQEIVEQLEPYVEPSKVEPAARAVVKAVTAASFHRGPLPPPSDLALYDRALPGAAERIVAMAEKNQDHRHAQEAKMVARRLTFQERGQSYALIALLAIIAAVVAIAYFGHAKEAVAFVVAITVSVVAAFLGRSLLQKRAAKAGDDASDEA
ncbi:MAG TPA: DUF2335 domain-containing protein [Caulobacteraceae bacterium]